MITMLVTYAGDEETPFDRDHWINVHFPLVRESWGPYGLISADGFFPQGDGAGRGWGRQLPRRGRHGSGAQFAGNRPGHG